MRALQEKLNMCSLRIQEGNYMFFHFSKTNKKEMVSSVIKHLKSLQDKIEKYFPTVSIENYKWVKNPFLPLDTHCILNLKEEELINIHNDGNIKLCTGRCLWMNFGLKFKMNTLTLEKRHWLFYFNFPQRTCAKPHFPF